LTAYPRALAAATAIRAAIHELPRIGVVLGTGLGDFAGTPGGAVSIPYRDLPHWPVPQVVGHEGRLVVGSVKGQQVVVLAGRCHAYEGHDFDTLTFAVRALGLLGVQMLILTNAAGGINLDFAPGTLMIIDDHLNLTGGNPLVGPNDTRFGPRFPDMTEVYSSRLRGIAAQAGKAIRLDLAHGTYAGVLGPSYETPAEIRHLRAIGADAVGMSTVPEAIAARHLGIEVLGISCITNMAAGVLPRPLDHQEVLETAARAGARFTSLLEEIIVRL
jgi:purine-nucleoside phosphorylase